MSQDVNDRRSGPWTLSAGQTGPHSFDFVIRAATELRVTRIRDGVETVLTYPTHYSVSVSSYPGTGTITLVDSPEAADILVIDGVRSFTSVAADENSVRLDAAQLNIKFDTMTRDQQELRRDVADTLRLPRGEGGLVFPTLGDWQDKVAVPLSAGGWLLLDTTDLEALGARTAEIDALSARIDEIDALYGQLAKVVSAAGLVDAGSPGIPFVVNSGAVQLLTLGTGLELSAGGELSLDADLATIAGLAEMDGSVLVGSGSGWVIESGDTALASLGGGATGRDIFKAATRTAFLGVLGADFGAAVDGQALVKQGAGLAFETPAGGGNTKREANETVTGDWTFSGQLNLALVSNSAAVLSDILGWNWTPSHVGGVARSLRSKIERAVNITDFDVVGDEVNEDAAGIQAAIDHVEALGGGFIDVPNGFSCRVSTQLRVSTSNVFFRVAGQGGFHDVGAGGYSARFIWYGAPGGTLLKFAPNDGASNQAIKGGGVIGVTLDGRDVAGTCLQVQSMWNGEWWLHTQRTTGNTVEFGVVTTLGEARDCQYNRGLITIRQVGAASSGTALWMGGDAGANFSMNDISVDIQHDDGDGMVFANTDNNVFARARVQRASGGTGRGMVFQGGATSDEASRDDLFVFMYPGAGGVELEGTATWASPAIDVRALHYDDQAGGSITLGAGCTFYYTHKSGVAVNPLGAKMVLADSLAQAQAVKGDIGSETVYLWNGSSNHTVLANGAGDKWGFGIDQATGNIRLLRLGGTGKILLQQVVSTTEHFEVSGKQVLTERQPAIANLTDNTGGTAGTGLSAVSGSGADAAINDNFATINAKLTALLAMNRTHGTIEP